MNYIVFIFESTHQVLKVEKILKENNIKYDIIPTPKEFSSDCGMSIRIADSSEDKNKIRLLLLNNQIAFQEYKKNA
ncbi:MAG TPA: DUF3343 domain-containing protein [Bacteroidales bacterium]|nr:DUF3343 domain-containing protein [Bacteroidales bacterium]